MRVIFEAMRALFADLVAAAAELFSADAAQLGAADKTNVSVAARSIEADCEILVVVILVEF